jgi:L-iditol 2-dehydrogenase
LEHPIDASRENVVARIREESEGRGADAVLLAVGGNALIRTAIDAARPGGRIMLFAQTQHGEATFDPAVVCMDEKTLMGSYSSSAAIQDDGVRMVVEGYTQGYDLTRLISHRFPLSRAGEAIAFASEPHPDSMKIMIEPGS